MADRRNFLLGSAGIVAAALSACRGKSRGQWRTGWRCIVNQAPYRPGADTGDQNIAIARIDAESGGRRLGGDLLDLNRTARGKRHGKYAILRVITKNILAV